MNRINDDIMGSKGSKKVALIGAGQLGSRHLQALAKIDIPLALQVVDPWKESLKIAKERFFDIPDNKNIESVDFLTGIDELNEDIDLCIIATTADVRFQVFNELLSKKNVSNLILEKIVFQSSRQFEDVRKIISQKNIDCWINCPRRMFSIYKNLKKHLDKKEKIKCHVYGGNWGLACNGIHFVDLLSFLLNDTVCKFDISCLDKHIYSGKRKGFIEISGKLKATFSDGSLIEIESIADSDEDLVFSIESGSVRFVFNETIETAKFSTKENNWKEETMKAKIPFQSELTFFTARDILRNRTCELTRFDDGIELHKAYIEAIKDHLENTKNRKYEYCAIT